MTIDMVDGSSGKGNVIKADKSLQGKVGTGPLNEQAVERAQQAMEETSKNVDFSPIAQQFLDELKDAIAGAKAGSVDKRESIQAMTTPVMQLKANSGNFNYHMVSNLANIMLSFLEAIKQLDDDAIEIVAAHHRTLSLIIVKKMKGDGGPAGKQMESELKAACKRYFMRKKG